MPTTSLQEERNALLKYVLLHPPRNVTISLPPTIKTVEDVDLTTCPLPLEVYYRAETNSSKETLNFDVASNITFRSEGSSLVPRSGALKTDPAPTATKSQLANNAMTVVASEAAPAAQTPPTGTPGALTSTEEGSMQAKASSASTLGSPSASTTGAVASPPATTAAAASASHSGASSLFGFRFGGLASKTPHGADSSHTTDVASTASASGTTHRAPAKLNPVRSLRAYFPPSLFGGSHGHEPEAADSHLPSSRHSDRCDEKCSLSASTVAPVRSWSFIPLNGTTPGTLHDTVATWLSTVPPRRPLPFGVCPEQYNVSLCPLFDSTMLLLIMNDFMHTVYEHVLIANALLLGPDRRQVSEEIYNVYMPALGISASDHLQCMTNLMPPSLRSAESRRHALSVSEVDLLRASLQCNETTISHFIANSDDDDFIGRMNELTHTIRVYRDHPEQSELAGSAPYPLVLRATLFATAMIPLYRINPATRRPYAERGSIDITLSAVKRLLSIPDELVDYCALHAHLYANEEAADDLKTQSTFLKGIARAVNTVVVNDSAMMQAKDLTPEVKYCYFVLQETLSLAMTPMPWLETLWSGDALRSVSALFIEVCLSLPPCFLSVFVLVDGLPLLSPQWSSGTCLLELLSFFMSVSAFRRFADVALDRMTPGDTMPALLEVLLGVDEAQIVYAQMLSKSFPHALGLVCPLRMQLATFALRSHWSIAPWYKDGETCTGMGKALASLPPPDLAPALNAVLYYLLDVTRNDAEWNRFAANAANASDTLVQTMEVLSLNASHKLSALQPIVEQYDALWAEKVRVMLRAVVSKGGWKWTTDMSECHEPPEDAVQIVRLATNMDEVPPPLGSSPSQIYLARLNAFAQLTANIVETILEGVPGVLASTRTATAAGTNSNGSSGGGGGGAGASGNATAAGGSESGGALHSRSASQSGVGGGGGVIVPLITSGLLHPAGAWKPQPLVVCERLTQYNTQYVSKGTAPTTPELVHRLNTLHILRQQLSGTLMALERQYERVMRVTGAPAVEHKSVHESMRATIRDADRQLCQSLGASAVLRPAFFSAMTTQLMRCDEKAYKALKRKEREAVSHMPLLYPNVTVERLLMDMNQYLLELLPAVPPGAAAEVRCQAGQFLVCLLYATYLEGDGVFLTPWDAQPILSELDTIRSTFFPQYQECAQSPGAEGGDSGRHQRTVSAGGGVPGAGPGRRRRDSAEASPGEQRLNELGNVVRYVMSQSSSLLVAGGNGVPPLSSLPDRADNSPWCKYIVHRVLDHRKDKDAKKQPHERSTFWGS